MPRSTGSSQLFPRPVKSLGRARPSLCHLLRPQRRWMKRRPTQEQIEPPPKKKRSIRGAPQDSQPAKRDKAVFGGCTIAILQGIGKVQRSILERRIREAGGLGAVVDKPGPGVTHVATSLSYDVTLKYLPDNWEEFGCTLVNTTWVTETLKLQERIACKPFIVGKPILQSGGSGRQNPLRRSNSSNGAEVGKRLLRRSSSGARTLARAPSDADVAATGQDLPWNAAKGEMESNELRSTPKPPPMPALLLSPSTQMQLAANDESSEQEATSSDPSRAWLVCDPASEPEMEGSLPTSNSLSSLSSFSSLLSSSDSDDEQRSWLRRSLSGQAEEEEDEEDEEAKVDDSWLAIPSKPQLQRAESGGTSKIAMPSVVGRAPASPVRNFPLARNKAKYFACQKDANANPDAGNVNKALTDRLEEMEKLEKQGGEQWRAMAYRKAATILRRHPKKIESVEDARRLRGIGEKISVKIGEILQTGTLNRLKEASKSDWHQAVGLFTGVWGAGIETAKKWHAMGYRTLDDLERNPDKLTKQQKIGLKYYEDFKARIPREEVTELGKRVQDALRLVDHNLEMEICGSYRRGAATCGDVDVLITNKKGEELEDELERLLCILHKSGFLTDDLSRSRTSPKYMGVCCLPPPAGSGLHRRIDFQTIPLDEWPCALLYFTGSAHLNRSMRLWARKNGFSLSEKSLVPRHTIPRGPSNNRKSNPELDELKGEAIPVKTERDIFDALGLEYKAPEERSL